MTVFAIHSPTYHGCLFNSPCPKNQAVAFWSKNTISELVADLASFHLEDNICETAKQVSSSHWQGKVLIIWIVTK